MAIAKMESVIRDCSHARESRVADFALRVGGRFRTFDPIAVRVELGLEARAAFDRAVFVIIHRLSHDTFGIALIPPPKPCAKRSVGAVLSCMFSKASFVIKDVDINLQ